MTPRLLLLGHSGTRDDRACQCHFLGSALVSLGTAVALSTLLCPRAVGLVRAMLSVAKSAWGQRMGWIPFWSLA